MDCFSRERSAPTTRDAQVFLNTNHNAHIFIQSTVWKPSAPPQPRPSRYTKAGYNDIKQQIRLGNQNKWAFIIYISSGLNHPHPSLTNCLLFSVTAFPCSKVKMCIHLFFFPFIVALLPSLSTVRSVWVTPILSSLGSRAHIDAWHWVGTQGCWDERRNEWEKGSQSISSLVKGKCKDHLGMGR